MQNAPYSVAVIADNLDATYYAYLHYVLDALADQGLVSFGVLTAADVASFRPGDFVAAIRDELKPTVAIFVRYALPHGADLVRCFKKGGVRTIYHIDDDLISLPNELGVKVLTTHGRAEVRAERLQMLLECSLVLPSTVILSERLRAYVPGTSLAGAMPPPFLGKVIERTGELAAETACIGYMASKSHGADLEMILPAIREVLDKREEVQFAIFGSLQMPSELVARYGGRVKSHGVAKQYGDFLRELGQMNWKVGLAPLVALPFNECKSGIKFLEYTAAGIPTIASPLPPYRVIEDRRNGLLAATPIEWSKSMMEILDDRQGAIRLVEQATLDCRTSFPLSAAQTSLLALISGS